MKSEGLMIGDWVVQENIGTYKIIEVCESWYEVIDNQNNHYSIGFDKEDMCHLWTIADAKEGDVLVDSYSKDSIIILYKGIYKERSILAHCGWNGYNFSVKTNGLGYGGLDNTNYLPATKEQRDLLFSKINQAGYEWDSEKKELKKIETASKKNEDERIRKDIIRVFKGEISFTSEKENEKYIAWLEKQDEQKQTWKPTAAQLIVIKDLIEDKNTSKVNKVILRGMFDEFKQYFRL